MSGSTPSAAGLHLKEEEDDEFIKLQRYVEKLSLEQTEAMRELVTPSKQAPIIRRGVAFEKPVDNWENNISHIDPKEEEDEKSPAGESMPMITPQILQTRAGFEDFHKWYAKEGKK